MGAGKSIAAGTMDSYSAEPDSGLEPQQSEHEQHQRGIRSTDGARNTTNYRPPARLGMDNINVEGGIRSTDGARNTTNYRPPAGLGMDNINIRSSDGAHNMTRYCLPARLGMNNINVERGTRSNVVARDMTTLSLLDRLGMNNNSNVERGIRSSPNSSQFQPSISMPSPVGAFHAVLASDLFVPGHTSIGGPSHLAVNTLQLTHQQGPSNLPLWTQLNVPVAPFQSSEPSQSSHGDSNQMAREGTRKRPRNNDEPNGCNCKKSRCLKLYCECFSTGFYCSDICSCKGCMNKPDYEDTVLDIRDQIELRDPHAFSPKVVEQGTGSQANTMEESSSARHKRGCNCKMSKCVKGYCECYRANVGCWEECRCANCENPFGTRAGVIRARTA